MSDNTIAEIFKKVLDKVATEEIDKLIDKKVEDFRYELLSNKDCYIAELMKSIRIFSEQQTIDNMPRYLITIENTYKLEK